MSPSQSVQSTGLLVCDVEAWGLRLVWATWSDLIQHALSVRTLYC